MAVFLWVILIAAFAAIVFEITCLSVVFAKAEKPWWGCIVPIYGIVLLCDIARRPRWWTLLCLIPGVNIVAYYVLSLRVARNFETGDGFGVGRIFVPVVSYAILAFGDADYCPWEPEDIAPAERSVIASPVPRSVSRPQQEAPPAFVERAVPVSAAPGPVTRAKQEAPVASDSVVERPRIARCPSCRKVSVGVIEEAGIRRCGSCLSVLPSYIQVTG
jgi:hypothetical protein